MYQWRELFVVRLLYSLITTIAFVCGIVTAPRYMATILSEGIFVFAAEEGRSCVCVLVGTIFATIWVVPLFKNMIDWRAELLIDEHGIYENISNLALKRSFIPWEEIEHIHIYPMRILPGRTPPMSSFIKNPFDAAIVLREGCQLQKHYIWFTRAASRSYPKRYRHVKDVDPTLIIAISFMQYRMNGHDVVRAMRKHANVSTHGKYRDG